MNRQSITNIRIVLEYIIPSLLRVLQANNTDGESQTILEFVPAIFGQHTSAPIFFDGIIKLYWMKRLLCRLPHFQALLGTWDQFKSVTVPEKTETVFEVDSLTAVASNETSQASLGKKQDRG